MNTKCDDCKYWRNHFDQIPCKTCIYNLGGKDHYEERNMTELRLNPEQVGKLLDNLSLLQAKTILNYDGPIFHKQRKPEVSK